VSKDLSLRALLCGFKVVISNIFFLRALIYESDVLVKKYSLKLLCYMDFRFL
jgi:hypothetical protein